MRNYVAGPRALHDSVADQLLQRGRVQLDQIPGIPIEVLKDGYRPIGLTHLFANELDASTLVSRVIPLKIVGIKKQKDTATGLIADVCDLLIAGRLRQQNLRTLWAL